MRGGSTGCARRCATAMARPPARSCGSSSSRPLRLRAEALGLTQVDLAGGALHLRFGEAGPLPPEALVARVRAVPGASLSPQGGVLRVPFPGGDDALEALPGAAGAPGAGRAGGLARPTNRLLAAA